jgi:hypothetical protein
VSRWRFVPLECRCGHVYVRRVVVSLCCFMHVSPSFSCARCGVIVVYFLLCVCVFMVKLCGSTIVVVTFFPKKKKNYTFCFAFSHNEGVITYGIRADSTLRLWIARISTAINL